MAKNKKMTRPSRRHLSLRPLIIILAVALYAALAAAAVTTLKDRTPTEVGQLRPGEVESTGFNRSLDLRAAAKNTYPSSPLAVVRDVGSANGVDHKIVRFAVKADGLTEYGLMYLPAGAVPKTGFPAIIYCHGYENPAHYSTVDDQTQDMEFLAERGFAVVKPDYRGQGLSADAGHADSAYYSMAYNTDVMSLISSLKQTKYIDKSAMNLWGFSMGSYIALRAAVLAPEIKNLILLSGPVDSLSKMYLAYIPSSDENNLHALSDRNEAFTKYGVPSENTAFWKYASPISLVGKIKARIQINVGALDQIVPTEFSADLDAALKNAHIAHDYYVYPDGDHSLASQRGLIWSRALPLLQPQNSPGSNA